MQPASEIAEEVRSGALLPVEAVEDCLERIDQLDDEIQAWVEVDREGALRRAEELAEAIDRGEDPGPLTGVCVGIKDIIDVAGLPTRAGAPSFAHYVPSEDATIVALLRGAGAIILGKTHTTEFAYLDPAPTRNPWNQEHTPGGSSSGSAAAVSAGMVPLAIGSQTVGSVLRPAGYCGIVGFKPSFGRISYAGVLALAQSFDHLGVLCTSVADAALTLSAVAGYDPRDPNAVGTPPDDYLGALIDPSPPRFGIPRNYYRGVAETEVEQHLDEIGRRLEASGAHVVEVTLPAAAPEVAEAAQPVMRVEAARAHAERYAANKDAYRPNIRSLIESGIGTSSEAYEAAHESVRHVREALSSSLRDVDVLLLPTAPGPAPAGLESTGPGIFCGPASFTGLPSIALPSGLSRTGLPLSVQLVGAYLAETRLLAAAAWTEQVLGFDQRPPLPLDERL